MPAVVDAALEAGITFFDTADSYLESESRLGRGPRVAARRGGHRPPSSGARSTVVRAAPPRPTCAPRSSAAWPGSGTDRIDLYQLHRPTPSTPIADTLGVLDELVREGKVREIGCSNFSAAQLREAEAAAAGGARFVTVQNQWNLLQREDESEAVAEAGRLGHRLPPLLPAGQRDAVGQVHAW